MASQGYLAAGSAWGNWATQVLQQINAPTSPTNYDTLWRWQLWEKPAGQPTQFNNPLNTTQPAVGATNAVGNVKAYPSLAVSASATAQTLTNGYYPDIISMFQNSVPSGQWSAAAVQQVTKWGTNTAFLGSTAAAPTYGSGQAGQTTGTTPLFGGSSGSFLPDPTAGIANAISSGFSNTVTGLFAIVEIGLGTILILAGAALLGFMALRGPAEAAARVAGVASPAGRVGAIAGGVMRSAAASRQRSQPAPRPRVVQREEEPSEVRAGGRRIELNEGARKRLRGAGYNVA